MTSEDIESLVGAAEAASKKARAPFSKYKVGAALMAEGGKVFTSFNIENPSLMLTMCAERIALYKAITEGEDKIKAIAIASNKGDYCYPCGACRQMLHEFAPEASVFLVSKNGIKRYTVGELLPKAFER